MHWLFLPPNDVIIEIRISYFYDVINGFVVLCQLICNTFNTDADDLLEYFEDTYIGRFRQNPSRRNPVFAIELWNMYHRTDQELPEQITASKGGIEVFKHTCPHAIQIFGIHWYSEERGSSRSNFNHAAPSSSSTKAPICGL